MTVIIFHLEPEQDEPSVSPGRQVRASVGSSDPSSPITSLKLQVNNSIVFDLSRSNNTAVAKENSSLGYDIEFDHTPWFDGQPVVIKLEASDGTEVLSRTVTFFVVDTAGPSLATSSPSPGEEVAVAPSTISFVLADPYNLHSIVPSIVDFQFNDANAEYVVPDIIGDPSPPVPQRLMKVDLENIDEQGLSFLGREGVAVDIDGQRRHIVSVHSEAIAHYSGAQIFGTSVPLIVYQRRGLDIDIGGFHVIDTGRLTPAAISAGWNATILPDEPSEGDLSIEINVPAGVQSGWTNGVTVPIGIRAGDDDGTRRNTSVIHYSFLIGSTSAPKVTNFVPSREARGVPFGVSPASDLAFDVTDRDGVDVSTLNVEVNGISAIVNGVAGSSPFASSTVSVIDDGFRVVIKNSSGYADGEIAVIDIAVQNSASQPKPIRTSYIIQFGTAKNTKQMTTSSGHLPSNAVIRCIAFDFSKSPFGRPEEMYHTGFGFDGYYYDHGSKKVNQPLATWRTSAGSDFPLCGFIAFTPQGWIIMSGGPTPATWMACAPRMGAGWSMAGNVASAINDGFAGPDDATLCFCTDAEVIAVSFSQDRAFRFTQAGREISQSGIGLRNSQQQQGFADIIRSLMSPPPYKKIGGRAWQSKNGTNLLAILAGTSGVHGILDFQTEEQIALNSRGFVFKRDETADSWARVRVAWPWVVVAGTASEQGRAWAFDVHDLVIGGEEELYLDNTTDPALPAGAFVDADINEHGCAAFAVQGAADVLSLVDVDGLLVENRTAVLLGLTSIPDARLTSVALERDTMPNDGYLYVAASTGSDGQVVRWREHSPAALGRSIVVDSGRSVSGVCAVGSTKHKSVKYVRGFMRLVE